MKASAVGLRLKVAADARGAVNSERAVPSFITVSS
jgi:hypothetical protein